MRRVLLISALLAAFAYAPISLTPTAAQNNIPDLCGSTPCIQVGTFNIKYLGSVPRDASDLRHIADLIANLEVAVLQEISTCSDDYKKLRDILYRKGYRFEAGSSGDEQKIVIVYKEDAVQLLGAARELRVQDSFNDCGPPPANEPLRLLRRPLVARFKAGQFDFTVVGVHLKSQREGACTSQIRRQQTQHILNTLANSEFASERDVIIVGDFNTNLSDANAYQPLTSAGFVPLTHPSRLTTNTNTGTVSYLIPKYAEVIDHLMVLPNNTSEWINRSTFIYDPPNQSQFIEHISDHAPVWASFRTGGADDD